MLKVFQIYFDDSQIPLLEKDINYTPFKNENCTKYFENEVIKNLILINEHKNSEYFGVVSYQLRDKIGFFKNLSIENKNISNTSINKFEPYLFLNELKKNQPDVLSFQRHSGHDPITFANKFHPNFSDYFKEIMYKIGYNWHPQVFENVFYCNFFVAKSEIYENYVHEMLIPAMNVMDQIEDLNKDSKYYKKLPYNLKNIFKVNHYTYHTFLCERMFSYYAHLKNLKCLHY